MSNLTPIDIKQCTSRDEVLNTCYDAFKSKLFSKDYSPVLFGKCVTVAFKSWILNRHNTFWHISSIDEMEIFDVLPCNNDDSGVFCNENCNSKEFQVTVDSKIRNVCLYRSTRISLITEIFNLADNKDQRVKVWKKYDKASAKWSLCLRFIDRSVDYFILLRIKENKYVLETAYPVFYVNAKKDYDTEYQKYINSQAAE